MRKPPILVAALCAGAVAWTLWTAPVQSQGQAFKFDSSGNAQVGVATALPAGTNAIGKLASNSGVVIGDVNLNGVTLSSGRVPVLADINNGSTTDTDDGTVAAAQASLALALSLGYEYDGTNWTRPRGPNTVAHDAVDAGNPLKIGFKAAAGLSAATLVADADRSNAAGGIDGILYTRPYAPLEDLVTGNGSNTDGTSTSLIPSSGAGVKTHITSFACTNTHASTDGYVELKDGSTAKYTLPVPHAAGAIASFPTPIPGTAATAWNFDPSAAITTIICSATAFKSKI